MIETTILEVDPNGAIEYGHYDHATDELTIELAEDVEPLIELNKMQFNAQERSTRHKGFTKIMSLPHQIYQQEKKKGTFDDKKAFSRFVNDPDNRVFRTRPGVY